MGEDRYCKIHKGEEAIGQLDEEAATLKTRRNDKSCTCEMRIWELLGRSRSIEGPTIETCSGERAGR